MNGGAGCLSLVSSEHVEGDLWLASNKVLGSAFGPAVVDSPLVSRLSGPGGSFRASVNAIFGGRKETPDGYNDHIGNRFLALADIHARQCAQG